MDKTNPSIEQNRKLICEVAGVLKSGRNKKLLYEIADVLKSRRYGIAESLSGRKVEEPQPSPSGKYGSMGILVYARPRIFGVIPIPFVGMWNYPADLWIDNGVRGATPDKRWVLDVYGNQNLHNARILTQQIAEPYGVEVIAKVSTNELRWAGQELCSPELESQVKLQEE